MRQKPSQLDRWAGQRCQDARSGLRILESEGSAMTEPEFNALEIKEIKDVPIAPGHAIGAIALNMALKYHDITVVKDGQLYQQYKLEGRNMTNLHLDMVFETAIQIERHLIGASDRIAGLLVEVLVEMPTEDESGGEDAPEADPMVGDGDLP
jgi:hypothetical protein